MPCSRGRLCAPPRGRFLPRRSVARALGSSVGAAPQASAPTPLAWALCGFHAVSLLRFARGRSVDLALRRPTLQDWLPCGPSVLPLGACPPRALIARWPLTLPLGDLSLGCFVALTLRLWRFSALAPGRLCAPAPSLAALMPFCPDALLLCRVRAGALPPRRPVPGRCVAPAPCYSRPRRCCLY